MKRYTTIAIIAIFTSAVGLQAQTVADFESHGLGIDSFANGADSSIGFWEPSEQDNILWFPTQYNFEYSYWSGGWALSTMRDDTTRGFANLYSAITAGGVHCIQKSTCALFTHSNPSPSTSPTRPMRTGV